MVHALQTLFLRNQQLISDNNCMKKFLPICAILSPVIFVLLSFIAGYITPNYNPLTDPISNLAILQHGWIQTLNFVLSGILMLFLGYSTYKALKGVTKAPVSFIYFGIILILSAIFQTDPNGPSTTTGIIHILLFVTAMIVLIISGFVFQAKLWRINKGLALYSLFTSITSLLFLLGIFTFNSYMGVAQRLLVYPMFIWIAILSYSVSKERNINS